MEINKKENGLSSNVSKGIAIVNRTLWLYLGFAVLFVILAGILLPYFINTRNDYSRFDGTEFILPVFFIALVFLILNIVFNYKKESLVEINSTILKISFILGLASAFVIVLIFNVKSRIGISRYYDCLDNVKQEKQLQLQKCLGAGLESPSDCQKKFEVSMKRLDDDYSACDYLRKY